MLNSLEEILASYKRMLLIRETENVIIKNYNSNVFKTPVHLAVGAEAIPCGILPYFKKRRVYGTYRNHHWYLEVTDDLKGFFREMLGNKKSPTLGRSGSMHLNDASKGMILNSAVVSLTIPVAVGDAWAQLLNGNQFQTICFFGDGATEEGVFFESLNFAALKKIPILFVCEDNGLAIHTHQKNRQSYKISEIVKSFGIRYYHANGAHIEQVLEVASQSVRDLQHGPVFLHIDYFRFLEHVGVAEDFHFNYREKPPNYATVKDPLWNCEQKLIEMGLLSKAFSEIQNEISSEVEQAFQLCLQEGDVDAASADDYVWAEKT